MENLTYAQKAIAEAIAYKTNDGIFCDTYTDTSYNDCSGGYYDTDD